MTMTNTMPITQPIGLIPTEHEMMVYDTMSKQADESKLYKGIGSQFAIKMIMLKARELNIPPMTALDGGIHIINGKTEISARLMAGMIFRAGHSVTVKKSDSDQCVLEGIRANGISQIASFTIEEAKQAGLVKPGGGWQKYPQDMLYARALSRLARRLFPDVIGTGYVEGEIRENHNKSMVENETEICTLEASEKNEQILPSQENTLIEFLSRFDKEEAKGWADYIGQIKAKMGISVQSIIDKYNEDPAKATEKFQTWIKKQIKTV